MNCTEARSRLHAYLDRELDLENALAFERHLAACGECRAAFESQSALQTGIRRHARHHAAPPGLAARIRAGLERESPASGGRAWRLRWPRLAQWLPLGAAVAATAVLSWTTAIQYASGTGDERLAAQVIAGHARAVLTAHRVDVASSDRHTVKPWLSSKLDFSPSVVDLANVGFPLDGGRLDYLDGRPVATLCYRRAQHTIDLFIWPQAKPGGDAPLRTFSAKGYHVARWREDGMEYWAASDVTEADLRNFAQAYAAAN